MGEADGDFVYHLLLYSAAYRLRFSFVQYIMVMLRTAYLCCLLAGEDWAGRVRVV
jgi:hypothetical protein